ncbi:MAG TPA: acetyl-CoA carboxylase biotin carboxyl carrier protein [Gemmatimonadales bacterium]|nr:acetyl-CoA carboxylase biotin carboxyl carrier protein [Gemmatimonadales bacterium]
MLARLLADAPGLLKGLEIKDVRRLVELMRESPDIGSIEVRGLFGTGVVVARTPAGIPQVVMPAHQALAPAPAAMAAAPPAAAPVSALKEVKSPMVGTFYAAPEPGAEPYVRVGQRVQAGQTVCIVEAMKIMNEIEAEVAGVVREISVEDAQPVEYGQVLFRVDPNG